VILELAALNEYIAGLAKALYTRGFDLPASPYRERAPSGSVQLAIRGSLACAAGIATEISLEEIWAPTGTRFVCEEYAYDLIDRPNSRRRAFHMHDGFMRAHVGVSAHEHCEEVLGQPVCDHYLGRELPNGYVALDLLLAAWLEPDRLGCDDLRCLQ
jgi:hypothetical protein